MTGERASWPDLAWCALVAALLLVLNAAYVSRELGFVHKPKWVAETDHLRYIEMAKGPGGNPELAREAPFCWRVLVPAIAGGLARAGLSVNVSFYLISNLSLFGFLLVLFSDLRERGFDRKAALLGIGLTGLMQGAVRWYEYQYWMTDPTCLFLVTLSLLLIRRGSTATAGLVVAANSLVRETSLVVLPYAFVRTARTRSLQEALRKTAAMGLSPAALLLALHTFIRPLEPASLGAVLEDVLSFRARHLLENQLYFVTAGTWGVLFPLVLLFPRRALGCLHSEELALVLTAYASLTLGNNTDRLLAYALPAVLPAGLWSLGELAKRARIPWGLLAVLALALQAVFWLKTRIFEGGMSVYQPTSVTVVVALGLFWIVARALLVWREKAAYASP